MRYRERKPINGKELLREQIKTQSEKCRTRRLEEYSSYISTNGIIRGPQHFTQRLQEVFGVRTQTKWVKSVFDGSRHRVKYLPPTTDWIQVFIKNLQKGFETQNITWTDIGCGHAIAQREFAQKYPSSKIHTVGIDLLPAPWKDIQKQIQELPTKEQHQWNRLEHQSHHRITGDATQMEFGPTHLITAIEVIQYIEDKIAALCHWYNQLHPGGLLVVATETSWADRIRLRNEQWGENRCMTNFLTQVRSLANYGHHETPNEIRTLIIRKENKTLKALSHPVSIFVNPHQYKSSYYPKRKEYVKSQHKKRLPTLRAGTPTKNKTGTVYGPI